MQRNLADVRQDARPVGRIAAPGVDVQRLPEIAACVLELAGCLVKGCPQLGGARRVAAGNGFEHKQRRLFLQTLTQNVQHLGFTSQPLPARLERQRPLEVGECGFVGKGAAGAPGRGVEIVQRPPAH